MAYHHGNLRRALLDTALELFVQRGAFDFTLRELAREAGVTHNAPYRHFAGKNELLAAIREEGFAMLAEAAQKALETETEPRPRVRALGDAYVRFAIERPHHFRLMLSEKAEQAGPKAGAFELLRKTLEEGRAAGVVRDDLSARELALAAWALVHGLASLVVNGHVPGDEARIRRYGKTLDAVFFEGVLKRQGQKRIT
ncbi:MAG: TetR/AcrR family transcriptional regulator [Polyangiales bacterium]